MTISKIAHTKCKCQPEPTPDSLPFLHCSASITIIANSTPVPLATNEHMHERTNTAYLATDQGQREACSEDVSQASPMLQVERAFLEQAGCAGVHEDASVADDIDLVLGLALLCLWSASETS